MFDTYRDIKHLNNIVLKTKYPQSYLVDSQAIINISTGLAKEKFIVFEIEKPNYIDVKSNLSNLERRFKSEPVAYIAEFKEFYSNFIYVNRNTLVPRSETEAIVEYLTSCFKGSRSGSVIDMCCGSGCISISSMSAKSDVKYRFKGIDSDPKALKVSAKNLKLNIKLLASWFYCSDLFKSIALELFDYIVCNPPYISTSDCKDLMDDVKKFEPKLALEGGKDGLDIYRRLAKESGEYLKEKGLIILEIGIDQKEDIVHIFKKSDYILYKSKKDLAGIERNLIFRKKKYAKL